MSQSDITVVMMSSVQHPEVFAEAVESFVRQTLRPRPRLLLACSHQDPVELTIDLDEYNIDLRNIERPAYMPEKYAWCLKQVQTRYWCIMDGDDVAHPRHLELLWNAMQTRPKVGCGKYACVSPGGQLYSTYNRLVPGSRAYNNTWTCRLWENRGAEFFQTVLDRWRVRKCSKHAGIPGWIGGGFDTILKKNRGWDMHVFEGPYTYLVRRGVSWHVSRPAMRIPYDPQTRLKEPIKPHWRQPYDKQIEQWNQVHGIPIVQIEYDKEFPFEGAIDE